MTNTIITNEKLIEAWDYCKMAMSECTPEIEAQDAPYIATIEAALSELQARRDADSRCETTAPDGVAKQPEAQSAPAMTDEELEAECDKLSEYWVDEYMLAAKPTGFKEQMMNLAKKYRG